MGAQCPLPRLLPDNLAVLRAWLECACTQWRRSGMGERAGLDYAAVHGVLRCMYPRTWKRLFTGIRVIERALMTVDSERTGSANEHAD